MQNDDVVVSSSFGRVSASLPSTAPPNEDFGGLSTDALLSHKNWKARKMGFEQIRDSPMALKVHFLEKPRKLVVEANAAAQEALFEALSAMVPVCVDEELDILVGEPLSTVVAKGITGRSKAMQASFAFVSDLVGVGKQTEVFNALIPAFAHKNPRNRATAIQLCSQIVGDYGVNGLPTKTILKAMQPLFNDANPQVRKEASNLCCQCYKYIGADIKGFLTDLRDVQLQELEKLFEGVCLGVNPPKSIRGVAKSTAKLPTTPLTSLLAKSGTSNDIDDAAFEACEETAVLSKLPRDFYRIAMDKTAKWQDRVSMLQEHLLPLIKSPKIRLKDDYHELFSTVREFLLDSQAPLMLMGFKCIQELARCMRASAAPYVRMFLNPLFDKMKDKKTSVVEHITTTLETLIRYHCITLDQCQDEIELTTQSRVPNQRLALTLWLTRLTERLDRSCFTRLSRAHFMLGRLMTDEKVEIREASCVLLARLMSLFGEGTFQTVIAALDDRQRSKLVAIMNSSVNLQCTPSSSPARKTQRTERRGDLLTSKPRSYSVGCLGSSSRPVTAQRVNRSHLIPRKSIPDSGRSYLTEDAVTLESTLPTRDDACRRMLGLLEGDTSVQMLLRSKEWTNRNNGVMKINTVVSGWSGKTCTENLDVVLVYLRMDPGWRESISQVFQAMLTVLHDLVNRSSRVSPGAGYAIVSGITGRLTEPKNKVAVCDLLMCLARHLGAAFVVRHIIGTAVSIKTPKLLQECNEFMCLLLKSFAISSADQKIVSDYVQAHCIESTFPTVRPSGVALLVALKSASTVDGSMESSSAAGLSHEAGALLLKPLPNNYRNSFGAEHMREISTVSSSRMARESQGRGSSGDDALSVDASAVLNKPRGVHSRLDTQRAYPNAILSHRTCDNDDRPNSTDVSQQLLMLSKQVTSAADWRVRLEAVKKIEELMHTNNKCIAANGVTEVIQALRSRFDEANKNFVVDVLRTISLVVESAGAGASRTGLRAIVQRILGMLGDQKPALREEAGHLADVAMECLGLDVVLQNMQKPLMAESHTCNQAALELIEKGFSQHPDMPVSRYAVSTLLPSVIRLCMSRILDVRSCAERVIGYFIPVVGEEAVLRTVKTLRPAEQKSIMGAVERQLQLYHRTGNEEGMRHAGACSNVPPTPRLSNTTPRSPCSPRLGGRDLGASAKSADMNTSENIVRPPVPAVVATKVAQARDAAVVSVSSESQRAQAVTDSSRNEEFLSMQEIMLGLRSASVPVALSSCRECMVRLQNGEDCGSPEVIQVVVERLHTNIKHFNVELVLALISCLRTIFETPRAMGRCHTGLLFQLIGLIFECLLSESFSLQEKAIKALNSMTLRLVEGSPTNDMFSALMSRMTKYSSAYIESGTKSDLKFIQVTVKCLMRLDYAVISPENAVVCCQEYLLQYPPSAFRELDDISIRTVKTILQDLSRRCGPSLLSTAERLAGAHNLVTHFVRSCLDVEKRTSRSSNSANSLSTAELNNEAQYEEVNRGTPNSSAQNSKARSSHVDPRSVRQHSTPPNDTVGAAAVERSVTTIFSRIRNHVTSNLGIEELYEFIKQHPNCPNFDQQFQRCSEAFRSYIKRKIERHMAEDTKRPPGFVLPEVLQLTP
ncbi:hypothetical protein ERJ75_000723200 [Trypanosoma vivax]|uniref:TOG domain-containing protein n=1 Tax=Trypanosoma vivax (strain Y486) TaxID=1055687 RepID=G0TWX9_TRYVY|nr:hypothetical protein TRVL_03064 [Trypanosoma vivax]KAH8613794.1 hypothetical protein ERJ75_000723200 [Trypanosoma vivax]CCC48467.1 conserved hypothetical protein [Trypanosoma vivax Y486]